VRVGRPHLAAIIVNLSFLVGVPLVPSRHSELRQWCPLLVARRQAETFGESNEPPAVKSLTDGSKTLVYGKNDPFLS
jgi:hypothetical protein